MTLYILPMEQFICTYVWSHNEKKK